MVLSPRFVLRNAAEFAAIFAVWAGELALIGNGLLAHSVAIWIIVSACLAKCLYFGVENLRQLQAASASNMPYHRFMGLMMVNMWQIATSFALDFHVLHAIAPESFAVVDPQLRGGALVFEFFYFSSLNFMFFGYGDITPQTIAAKVMTLTEITLAFVTVIFLLSDFISLKDSLRRPQE